ncbi:multidrug effflux MFS transporter [Oecophyllibacter saccharovorans]|uniref:multidrug effflux MFS transporter n=1 Tax=Oecophyllibacter saccharovorans TaxID=2558360 RepID=UPI001E43AB85|nr:multidrug effflux MFS transporter [Oecophyllibacter saccharovorans]
MSFPQEGPAGKPAERAGAAGNGPSEDAARGTEESLELMLEGTLAEALLPAEALAGPESGGSGVGPGSDVFGPAGFRRVWMLGVLSLLMAFAAISIDVYLPAMPAMSAALHASVGAVEWTVSAFLIGFSLGQLVWGPVGDRLGRRLPIALGLVFFVLGAISCALAPTIGVLIGGRVIMAFGASSGVVLARAMVRDLHPGPQGARMLSTLIVAMACAPLLGPFVGSAVLNHAGWRAIFWLLAITGVLTFGLLFTLPETHPPEKRRHVTISGALRLYGRLLTQRGVMGFGGTGAFYYGGMFAYVAGVPFAYIGFYHVAPSAFGYLFGLGILGVMATNALNARWVEKVGILPILRAGTAIALLAGVLTVLTTATGWGGLWGLVLSLLGFMGITGLIVANSIAGALQNHAQEAGAVSALVGALQYGSGILGSGLTGWFADGTPWPMGCVIGLAGLGSFLCLRLLVRPPLPGPRSG